MGELTPSVSRFKRGRGCDGGGVETGGWGQSGRCGLQNSWCGSQRWVVGVEKVGGRFKTGGGVSEWVVVCRNGWSSVVMVVCRVEKKPPTSHDDSLVVVVVPGQGNCPTSRYDSLGVVMVVCRVEKKPPTSHNDSLVVVVVPGQGNHPTSRSDSLVINGPCFVLIIFNRLTFHTFISGKSHFSFTKYVVLSYTTIFT